MAHPKAVCEECGTELQDYGVDWMCPKCPTFMSPDYVWTDERKLEHLQMSLSVTEMSYQAMRRERLRLKTKIRQLEEKIAKKTSP